MLRPFEKYRWNKRDLSVIRTAAPFFIFPRIRGKKEMGANSLPFSCSVGERKLMIVVKLCSDLFGSGQTRVVMIEIIKEFKSK